jgi:divalent metal cation (Fe/Co/Zn/Cd) transporter
MINNKYINIALVLAIITVFYNVIEGLVSVYFGVSDESLSLFGFGVDSFVEVLSGIGIWHMMMRIKRNGNEQRDGFEKRALTITGISFYILSAGLILTIAYNIYTGHKPETTFWGIVISSISILTMILLMRFKLKIGKTLKSDAIIADANCTRTCVYSVHLGSSIMLSGKVKNLWTNQKGWNVPAVMIKNRCKKS